MFSQFRVNCNLCYGLWALAVFCCLNKTDVTYEMKICKLLKIKEDYHHMPLDKIPVNLPKFPKECSIKVGSMDGLEIYGSREYEGWEVYGIKQDGVCIAYIIISEREYGEKTHHFREIWVHESLRGRGYASILILFLLNKLKLKLFVPHDEIVSPMIRGALGKLFDSGKIGIDVNTGRDVNDVLRDTKKTADSLIIKTVSEDTEFPIDGIRRETERGFTLQEKRSVLGGDFE